MFENWITECIHLLVRCLPYYVKNNRKQLYDLKIIDILHRLIKCYKYRFIMIICKFQR